MTKEEMVELVYLRIAGGKPSSDVNIKRVNISFYFSAAYNHALLFDYYEKHGLMMQERRLMGYSSQSNLLEQQLFTYPVTVTEDAARGLRYFPLPKSLLVMPGGRGLSEVFGDTDSSFVKVGGQQEVVGLDATGANFYWFEKYPSEDRVYIKGGCSCDLFVRMMVDPSALSDTDEVNLPAGRESMVLDKMAEWFLGERALPENNINENVDDIHK